MGLTITEGAPTTTTRVFHSGRGGAGNYHSVPKNLPPPPTTVPVAQPQTHFYAGRGGAGNARKAAERTVFSFEEIERDRIFHEHHAPVYSVGRGGAGNMVPADNISTRSHYSGRSDATPRTSTSTDRTSVSSINSGRHHTGLADRVMRTISRVRSSASH